MFDIWRKPLWGLLQSGEYICKWNHAQIFSFYKTGFSHIRFTMLLRAWLFQCFLVRKQHHEQRSCIRGYAGVPTNLCRAGNLTRASWQSQLAHEADEAKTVSLILYRLVHFPLIHRRGPHLRPWWATSKLHTPRPQGRKGKRREMPSKCTRPIGEGSVALSPSMKAHENSSKELYTPPN